MGTFNKNLSQSQIDFIRKQKLFFVATAPISSSGRVNLSPKGIDGCFSINPELNEMQYLEWTGSGAETISHIKENERLTIMFCAFDGVPKIIRLFGKGKHYPIGSPEFFERTKGQDIHPQVRSVIILKFDLVGQSCGYGVPFYEYKEDRKPLLTPKNEEKMVEYRRLNNTKSLDGLEGFKEFSTSGTHNSGIFKRLWNFNGREASKNFGLTHFIIGVSFGLIIGFTLKK
ncbi:hypothetical protein HDU92_004579 [Lobulomyces angularis]|nr:hypothetical protein HDU92_004579 [Lobulomyces angularis]